MDGVEVEVKYMQQLEPDLEGGWGRGGGEVHAAA